MLNEQMLKDIDLTYGSHWGKIVEDFSFNYGDAKSRFYSYQKEIFSRTIPNNEAFQKFIVFIEMEDIMTNWGSFGDSSPFLFQIEGKGLNSSTADLCLFPPFAYIPNWHGDKYKTFIKGEYHKNLGWILQYGGYEATTPAKLSCLPRNTDSSITNLGSYKGLQPAFRFTYGPKWSNVGAIPDSNGNYDANKCWAPSMPQGKGKITFLYERTPKLKQITNN